MRLSHALLGLVSFSALSIPGAIAQGLLVCRHSPARVELFNANDGSLIDASFIDVDGLVGLGGGSTNIWDVIRAPNGELFVTNYSARVIHRFSADGSMYLGDLPTTAGQAAGLDIDGGTLAIASVGGPGGVYGYDIASMVETQVSPTAGNWDVTAVGGQWLAGRTNGTVVSIDPATGVETLWSDPTGFCEQIVELASGQVLVANYSLQGYTVHDATGAILQTYTPTGVGNIRGVAPLANGNVMLSGVSGLHVFNPSSGTVVQVDSGASAFIFGDGVGGGFGTNFCSANANSTGSVGGLSAIGSTLVSTNDVTLQVSDLPLFVFGFFIASRTQGFVQNPGGSTGNLCLGGAIGRYVGPGQIQQTNGQGMFSLSIDLANVPQPLGFVAVQPGETWSFQAWHRDSAAGQATSNFTTGLEVTFL